MRLLLTALHCPKGALEHNAARARELLAHGRGQGCDLVLLPEMSLTGYRPSAAVPLDADVVTDLVASTAGGGPALSFGLVEARPGGPPYITQVVAAAGELTAVHRKSGLGEGEAGLFHPGMGGVGLDVGGTRCSFAVCAEIGTSPPYQLAASLVLGPAAPGLYGVRRTDEDWQRGLAWWRSSVLADARSFLPPRSWLAVSTQAGATDDEDFPGWAALVASGGTVVAELDDWREGVLVVDVPLPHGP